MVHILLCVLVHLVLLSCGKRQFPDYKGDEDVIFYEEAEGTYTGEFIVLNRAQTRFNADLILWIRGDQFYTKIFLPSGPARIRYQQYLHKGSRCPTLNDDTNHDGVIDMSEVFAVSGEILIPLDGYIQEQERGSGWYPVATKTGSYYYSRSASVTKMLQDLHSRDPRRGDGMTKLRKGEHLDLTSRVIVIYGTKSDPLFPVACSYIKEKYL
jgi:hypothetical protein